ncbi:MAG: phosphoenolpyruvate carboxykinase (ATP) [Methanobacteriota archaeon]|nr:MAG: phosphoenolpyruvate carboxykinase (ATP) [Euryarchaeota archaeon]|tara:strand:- start:8712 stop:10319 length:1608 start_codon:yes stop_codon:yes gene_type:complete
METSSDRAEKNPSTPTLLEQGIKTSAKIFYNLDSTELIEMAVKDNHGFFTKHKALVTETGSRTGRSPNDRFIVEEESSKDKIHWGKVNVSVSLETFSNLRSKLLKHISMSENLFIQNLYCGADKGEWLPIRVISESAWHSAFARNMFIRPNEEDLSHHIPKFTVFHSPSFFAEPEVDNVNSEAFVIINFEEGQVIIGGTSYAGEIKKSIFSVMNYLLPLRGILPMHCSANTNGNNTAVFFGLSGTGKTTLSADPLRELIGDDEHGWGPNGVFNFEGGCYAKLINLKEEDEPEIFGTTRKFGSILENIVVDDDGTPNFFDTSKTQNTRGSYPIEFIENRSETSQGGHPQNVIFLTCDAFGVLPPISELTPSQAAYHFISGYTAKVAGTEIGVVEPTPEFSACFGEPFMPMHPGIYADLLSQKINEHNAKCWLINTGWSAGPYGIGSRIKIKHTRAMLNAAMDGKLENVEYVEDPRFGFKVPLECPGVPSELLQPRDTWHDKNEYDDTANKLVSMFKDNFTRYGSGVSDEVNSAGPI